jgi:hypothetical protein
MFLSHLNFFISLIVFFLFIIRKKHHSTSETLFVLFSFLFTISSFLWLIINYYNFNITWLIDSYGVFCENILLTIPILALFNINNKKNNILKTIFFLITGSLVLYFLHWIVAHHEKLIFHPTNPYMASNILFQIVIDLFLFLVFLSLLKFKRRNSKFELFDGNFKKYFIFSFGIFYIQDIFILFLLYLSSKNNLVSDTLFDITTILNSIIAIHLIFLALYTNWLREYNYIRLALKNSEHQVLQNNEIHVSIEELKEFELLNWNEIALNFKNKYPLFIHSIEQNTLLSKTEKLYAFLDNFNFSHKELADLLNVSIRTVETNFYRTRRKL